MHGFWRATIVAAAAMMLGLQLFLAFAVINEETGLVNRILRSAKKGMWPLLILAFLLLGCLNCLYLLPLCPLAVYHSVGSYSEGRRKAWRTALSPALLPLPCLLVVWLASHQAMSFLLISCGQDHFLGGYLFPGVVELGYYQHDPAGRKYRREGITPEIAPVMTDTVKRFQTFGDSQQVYDCVCIEPFYCRNVPVIEGAFATGSIYAELSPDRWTPSILYAHSGPWSPGLGFRSTHVGFPILALVGLAGVPFGYRVWFLRRRLHRTRQGRCWKCGYDLTGNMTGTCPECGTRVASRSQGSAQ